MDELRCCPLYAMGEDPGALDIGDVCQGLGLQISATRIDLDYLPPVPLCLAHHYIHYVPVVFSQDWRHWRSLKGDTPFKFLEKGSHVQ